jgi:acyl-CoA hydrolase
MSGEPLSLTSALWSRWESLRDVTVVTGMMVTGYPFLRPGLTESFRLLTWFLPDALTGTRTRSGQAEYLPWTWRQVAERLPDLGPDIAFVQVAPADAEGYHSFGSSASLTGALIGSSSMVVAEVNPRMPTTAGARVHRSRLHVTVEAEHELPELRSRRGGAVDRAIAAHVASLVPEGSTLQVGLGTIPEEVARQLAQGGARGLRLHSLVNDGARELVEAGACTPDPPQVLAAELLGSRALYDWADRNPAVEMAAADATHGLRALGRIRKLVALNSALEVDLYGQVNAELLEGWQVGGVGGSLDFAMGAQYEGARFIVALRSTTSAGASRIVPSLRGPVTIPRQLGQLVVTEHGVVDLRQGSVRERAEALVAIAAPEHREELQRAAGQL